MTVGYFITGTDTGVGKTLIASALVHAFAAHGHKAIGMKPVAAGCAVRDGCLVSDDVAQLMTASNVSAPLQQINCYSFEPAIAPHIAARQAGVEIELDVIKRAYTALADLADVIIVEGVGGFCVPLSDYVDTMDLAQALDLPVILVVGMRLGCLNHALLTAAAIKRQGLKLAGWIANGVDAHMTMPAENLHSLKQRIHAPCLGVVPWQPQAGGLEASAFEAPAFEAIAPLVSSQLLNAY